LKIAATFNPFYHPIASIEEEESEEDLSQLSLYNWTSLDMIRTCEPANLIFPNHFKRMANYG
jgi:hypothetical protein